MLPGLEMQMRSSFVRKPLNNEEVEFKDEDSTNRRIVFILNDTKTYQLSVNLDNS